MVSLSTPPMIDRVNEDCELTKAFRRAKDSAHPPLYIANNTIA